MIEENKIKDLDDLSFEEKQLEMLKASKIKNILNQLDVLLDKEDDKQWWLFYFNSKFHFKCILEEMGFWDEKQ